MPEEQLQGWKANRTGVLVGERLALVNGWKVGDTIPISSNIFSNKDGTHVWQLKVEGIFSASEQQTDTGYLLIHYKYFMETQTWGGDYVGWLIITTTDPAINERVAKAIDENFANSQAETDTSTEKAFNKAFIEQIGNIGLIIYGIVFMAFFTILVLVGNTMVLAIRERTGEIAVLKTLGFSSPRHFQDGAIGVMPVVLYWRIVGIGCSLCHFARRSRIHGTLSSESGNGSGDRDPSPDIYVSAGIGHRNYTGHQCTASEYHHGIQQGVT